jgi:hypothetical protein
MDSTVNRMQGTYSTMDSQNSIRVESLISGLLVTRLELVMSPRHSRSLRCCRHRSFSRFFDQPLPGGNLCPWIRDHHQHSLHMKRDVLVSCKTTAHLVFKSNRPVLDGTILRNEDLPRQAKDRREENRGTKIKGSFFRTNPTLSRELLPSFGLALLPAVVEEPIVEQQHGPLHKPRAQKR